MPLGAARAQLLDSLRASPAAAASQPGGFDAAPLIATSALLLLLLLGARLSVALLRQPSLAPALVWAGLAAAPCAFAAGALLCREAPGPAAPVALLALGLVTLALQALLASRPMTAGIVETVGKLPRIVKEAQKEMQRDLQENLAEALRPLVAGTPAEHALGLLTDTLCQRLQKCITSVTDTLDLDRLTPKSLRSPGFVAAVLGSFMIAVMAAFVLPSMANLIQLHLGLFFGGVLALHLVLFLLALNAHRVALLTLSLSESIYNGVFHKLLEKLLDDMDLEGTVRMVMSPGGSSIATVKYIAGAVVDTMASPILYITGRTSCAEDGGAGPEASDADEERPASASGEDGTGEDGGAGAMAGACGTQALAGPDGAGAIAGACGTQGFSVAALKATLLEIAWLEFAMPEDEDEAAEPSPVSTEAPRRRRRVAASPSQAKAWRTFFPVAARGARSA